MNRETSLVADEAAVRDVIDSLIEAVRARDVGAMLALCAPDIVTFDMLPPLEHDGQRAVRQGWSTALGAFEGRIDYTLERLELEVGGDVAFTRCLARFGGTRRDGARSVSWLRMTLGLRRTDGHWRIVHQHVSVPYDMASGKALVDLKP